MCRWAAYLGEPIFMSEIVTSPANSLIKQAQSARESITETNADGFGPVSYTHLRAHETSLHLVCRLLLEKKK